MTHQVIYKYPVSLPPCTFSHEMPKGAEVLCVQMQGAVPQIWALVDPEMEKENRRFAVIGTGRGRDDLSRYVGTFQALPFVWHVFEI